MIDNSRDFIRKKLTDHTGLTGNSHLNPRTNAKFKEFVEKYYVHLRKDENIDDFFAKYDRALDSVDKDFRIKHGIFFTDLSLSKFALWYVKQSISNLGEDYLVIDPACGSGNLVTNWRAPLQLRHKIVSEIEPELLFTVENRMKGDAWHYGKYTVIPRVAEGKGLNFLTHSASDYLDILKNYLPGKDISKPIAFLCNPPYRGDDDQSASSIEYQIHPDIISLIGKESATERYSCFLAQMKLICDKATDSGLPEDSLLLVFTKSSWLTDRPSFEKIQNIIMQSFDFAGGLLFNSKEFFDVKGKFPIAFTIWKFKNKNEQINTVKNNVMLCDLTWVGKKKLQSLPWPVNDHNDTDILDGLCTEILNDKKSVYVSLSSKNLKSIKEWTDQKMTDFKRDRRKSEIGQSNVGGLPKNDPRMQNKKAYGDADGGFIGFMDNLTPCRIKRGKTGFPWFRLDSAFMDCRKIRCFSGPTPVKSYHAFDLESAKKTFFWFSVGRTIAQTGFPMWVDAVELWAPFISDRNDTLVTKFIFAIGFADNECIETFFPSDNPIEGLPPLYITNPMSPNNPNSFWSKIMAPIFNKNENTLPDLLVMAVNEFYAEWSKRFSTQTEKYATFTKPYFVENGVLRNTSGVIQIKEYAEIENDLALLALYKNIKEQLKEVKLQFYEYLLRSDGLNYFAQDQSGYDLNHDTNSINKVDSSTENITPQQTEFDRTQEKRISLTAIILDTLKGDKNLGRTKLAKILYLCDVYNHLELNAKYYRQAAGPLDSVFLYNKEFGIEAVGEKYHYFTTHSAFSKKIIYQPGKNFNSLLSKSFQLFKDKLSEIKKIISYFEKLDTEQSEILVTLFACWNDLLIDGKNITEEAITYEFYEKWNPKKKRFDKNRLLKALDWMKTNGITPNGRNKNTHTYTKNDFDSYF